MCAESEMHGFVLWLFLDLLKTPLEQVVDGQAVYLHGRSRAGKGSKSRTELGSNPVTEGLVLPGKAQPSQ